MEFQNLSQWSGFALGAVLSMIAQGEGQAFFVLMFQVFSQRERVVWDLHPVRHIDVRSIPLLLLSGWAWSRKRIARPPYFPDSWVGRLVPLAGAVAVFLLSGILGTLYLTIPEETIKVAVEATILIGVANLLIPIPPLALGRALCCPFENSVKHQPTIELVGAIVLTGWGLAAYWMKWTLLQDWLVFFSAAVTKWVLHG